jgi:hypothetical protein
LGFESKQNSVPTVLLAVDPAIFTKTPVNRRLLMETKSESVTADVGVKVVGPRAQEVLAAWRTAKMSSLPITFCLDSRDDFVA